MVEIIENQELLIENVLCYRGTLTQNAIAGVGEKMDEYIKQAGAKRVGTPITAIYGVQGDMVDICLVVPIDKDIASTEQYTYKKFIKITNAVKASYKGDQAGVNNVVEQLNNYMMKRGLEPITVGYNVTRQQFATGDVEIDIYVGVNPNVL